MITAGIDIGSRTTKVVIYNGRKVLSRHITTTGWKPSESGEAAFYAAVEAAGLKPDEVEQKNATGYGRVSLPIADKTVTEITCHAKGAYYLDKSVRTIIDIGGQDSKIIRVDENGFVEDFAMNDRCAAGTGKFLEFLSHSLGIEISEFGNLALNSNSPVTISSMCTVFAESEVLSLAAEDVPVKDIVAGLHLAIARRIISLSESTGYEEKIMLTGGVAHNVGMRHAVKQVLKADIFVADFPEYTGALGAAIL